MEQILLQILQMLREGRQVDDATITKLMHEAARNGDRAPAKRRLLPFYLRIKREDPVRWASWGIDPRLEAELLRVIRMKPRRTASGVATVTVITKPWPCSGDCVFCPNDLRMPKSYLHDEPACARAEQNFFDPYLQVVSRLTALSQMGHAIDKVEVIVLGGTWTDYPQDYRVWFVSELFRALNEGEVAANGANPMLGQAANRREAVAMLDGLSAGAAPRGVAERRERYLGLFSDEERADFERRRDELQRQISDGPDVARGAYNAAVKSLYAPDSAVGKACAWQRAGWEELELRQSANETARHRMVGLVIETRPDALSASSLSSIRRLGCTKIQMGIQSLDQKVLDANGRRIDVAQIREAFELCRLFGFKVHAHFMVNLLGSDPKFDKADYRRLIDEGPYQPDEVKLYPCALIGGTRLERAAASGAWRPYTEEELLDVLAEDVRATPAYCRISRMIRDFSTNDVVAGNKKPNLRQLVEGIVGEDDDCDVEEIRYREIGSSPVDPSSLRLDEVTYETSMSHERFLQWVTPEGRIAGFLRLSLPDQGYVEKCAQRFGELMPIGLGEAMIREVHVYGAAVPVGDEGDAAQHHGLGRALIARACEIARAEGYDVLNVISAVGTREYYRGLGFADNGLYQRLAL